MGKRHSINDVIKTVEKKGGQCLSKEYKNNHTKMLLECKHGHQWESIFKDILRNHWCPYCAGTAKKTIEDCEKFAKSKDGKCLSKKYEGIAKKLSWQCSCGNVWQATPGHVINNNSWCPKCAGVARLSLEECLKIAKDKGGECLSRQYKNNRTKMLWKCSEGHIWRAHTGSIKRGRWCPLCAETTLDIKDCTEVAENRGGKCLSKEYKNCYTPIEWECGKGHRWKAKLGNIRCGSWCPTCARPNYTINDCILEAKKNGGCCLSKEYKNIYTNMVWKCSCGHVWENKFSKICRGVWCPKCSVKMSKYQRKLTEIIKSIFPKNTVVAEKRFKWLGAQSIDIYVDVVKLAIEYDGEQHFGPVRFKGISQKKANELYKKTIILDTRKNKLISRNGEDVKFFLRFDYTEAKKLNKEYVVKKLKKQGVKF